ncbi:MAG: hypothetical protein GY940_25385, partial [bacterium]|nr:hypothetical protein [bacterium]
MGNIRKKHVCFIFILVVLLSTVFISSCRDKNNQSMVYDRVKGERIYLNHAIDAASWLRSTFVEPENNELIRWPDDNLKSVTVTENISSGVAGKILFFIELFKATNNKQYLDDARRGAGYLLRRLEETGTTTDAKKPAAGFYGGLAGLGYTLSEAYKVTGDEAYRKGAVEYTQRLHALAVEDEQGVTWNDSNDILNGNAGIGLYLLYAARELKHRPSLELAVKAGKTLLARAVRDKGGLTWKNRVNGKFFLPNFSHGAAGIGYFLATVYQESKQKEFLDAAIAAAAYLEAIAKTEKDVFMVPYGFPDIGWGTPYDTGWAHGPAGTARLFQRLWQVTKEDKWRKRVWQCANGITASGMPGMPGDKEVYGEKPFKIDMRFGQASVARFFMELYTASAKKEYLEYARKLTDDLVGKGKQSEKGLYWPMKRYMFMPDGGKPAEYTGYFYGAVGFGMTLLHLD